MLAKPFDVLKIVNDINAFGSGPLDESIPNLTDKFIDVSGDSRLEPIDVLQVVNYLNANGLTGTQLTGLTLTIVPEPATHVLLGVGAAAMIAMVVRRRRRITA